MSNARNLSNLLGSGTTIATASIADDAITSAKLADDSVVAAAIATDAVGADALSSSAIASGDLPTGSVIQVVTARSTGSAIGTTSTTDTDSGIGITITPKFSSSKILLDASFSSTSSSGNAANAGTTFDFYRSINGGSYTALISGNGFLEYSSDSGNYNHSVAYIGDDDSPNTTSAVTYRIYIRTLSGFSGGIQRDWGGVNLRAIEVAV